MKIIKNFLWFVICFCVATINANAASDSARADLSFTLERFVKIQPITSPVLTANIIDRSGNLYQPLHARFKVISNSEEKIPLYLKANTVTDAGYEEAMFSQNGQVYIAFANLVKKPTSASLANCKMGSLPKDSPGVVAYPVISVSGAENKYLTDKNKYELSVPSGVSYVDIHIGSHVLRTSFASNDPKGFYQAVLSLSEIDT